MMLGGYAGTILHVDLSKRTFKKEKLDPKFARAFLGGRGFGAKLLFDHIEPGVDPLSPGNVLIFATGPFTGTSVPKGQRYSVVNKSPLTNGYGDAEGGGHFGPELKFAGYDALVIKGKAEKPVYLWIDDETSKLEDASHLWGKGVLETDKTIKEDKADKLVRIAAVGPAAEKLVRFAAVTNDLYRHAARGGGGTVMGSKNLKAVAVRGFGAVEAANTDEFNKVAAEMMKKIIDNPARKGMYDYGTWGGGGWDLKQYNLWGIHPTRNYRSGYFENYEKIYGVNFRDRLLLKQRACFACPIACGRQAQIREGPYKGTFVEGPEYETITMLGSD
jgi:aldehyde:ferredoxin oxidoreductase